MAEPQHVWTECCAFLRDQVAEGVWMSTFREVVPLDLADGELRVAVPSALAKQRIEGPYRSLVATALKAASDDALELVVEVQAGFGIDEQIDTMPDLVPAPALAELDQPDGVAPGERPSTFDDQRPPDPIYTFDAFVIGPSNRFAHAAALSVAETPGRAYNPLFIYGDAGLGKTHLLQAIRHYVADNYPAKVVRYVSAEAFLNEFVESIRFGAGNEFKKRWREIDVLLVDDIQFIEKAERFQEEFFHTFNELHDRRSQIVLTSDRPPDAISTLEKRLRSRFMMGLITDIQPPDVETRIAILRKKAEKIPTPVSDEVLDFIAEHITDNIRELEGALTRVTAYANLYEQRLTVELAQRVLSDIIGANQPRAITPKVILDATAAMFGFTEEEITGKSRRRPLVTARQVAMYVMRELTDLSYPAIAREFGGRDHTTVMHAVEKVGALMQERKQIFQQVQALVQDIKKG